MEFKTKIINFFTGALLFPILTFGAQSSSAPNPTLPKTDEFTYHFSMPVNKIILHTSGNPWTIDLQPNITKSQQPIDFGSKRTGESGHLSLPTFLDKWKVVQWTTSYGLVLFPSDKIKGFTFLVAHPNYDAKKNILHFDTEVQKESDKDILNLAESNDPNIKVDILKTSKGMVIQNIEFDSPAEFRILR